MLNKFLDACKKYDMGFYASILGLLIMGTFHLVMTCISFSWLTFNYMLFCYLMMFARTSIYSLYKKDKQGVSYLLASIYLMLALIPLVVSFYKTITERELVPYIFDWIIYGYAAYAFYKLITGIINLVKSRQSNVTKNILCWYNLVNAFFTMFMLEFTLIRTFSTDINTVLIVIEYSFQAYIISFTMFVIGVFIHRYIKIRKGSKINE